MCARHLAAVNYINKPRCLIATAKLVVVALVHMLFFVKASYT
jgi:hypothetical protein